MPCLPKMQGSDKQNEMGYFNYLQPHGSPNFTFQTKDVSQRQGPEIYENPSEHYASINHDSKSSNLLKKSAELNMLLPHVQKQRLMQNIKIYEQQCIDDRSGAQFNNFYGYGEENTDNTDYETGCSEYDATESNQGQLDKRTTSSRDDLTRHKRTNNKQLDT